MQSERLFQQPTYYPTWNQSGPPAWQESNIQVYSDVRNEYQLCQSTYPPAPPLDQFVYSSDQPTFGSSDDTWPPALPPDEFSYSCQPTFRPNQPTYSPVEDAQPQYFNGENALLDRLAYQKEEKCGHGSTEDNFDFEINIFND